MAVKLLVPWWTHPAGHVVELGEAFDEKMISKGKAVKVEPERKAARPKEKTDER